MWDIPPGDYSVGYYENTKKMAYSTEEVRVTTYISSLKTFYYREQEGGKDVEKKIVKEGHAIFVPPP
jgi:hypothetical protein